MRFGARFRHSHFLILGRPIRIRTTTCLATVVRYQCQRRANAKSRASRSLLPNTPCLSLLPSSLSYVTDLTVYFSSSSTSPSVHSYAARLYHYELKTWSLSRPHLSRSVYIAFVLPQYETNTNNSSHHAILRAIRSLGRCS